MERSPLEEVLSYHKRLNPNLPFEELHFGFTINEVRRLAYQFAEKNEIPYNFNKEPQIAGGKGYGF